jgi:hypothetical protein
MVEAYTALGNAFMCPEWPAEGSRQARPRDIEW